MRILVVEDDRLLNNTLCYNLDTAGYVVDSALTKSAASNFLTKQDYDLIVLDVNLPDGNGFDFCREVKELSLIHISAPIELPTGKFLLCLFGKLFDTGLYPADLRIVVSKLVAFKGPRVAPPA